MKNTYKILVYKEKNFYLARCLENNLVAQASTLGQIQIAIRSLLDAQVELDLSKGRKAFSTNSPAKNVYHTIFDSAAKFRFPDIEFFKGIKAELALAI